MIKDLLKNFENLFKTKFIYPEIFRNFNILGLFSKKLPLFFNFTSLNYDKQYKFFFPKQIHSTKIIKIFNSFSEIPLPFSIEGDGVLTNQKRLFLGIRTADCVPILLATKDGNFIGAIHAGWRGTLNKILEIGIKNILESGYKASDILIALGPHIKKCCYEVKDIVLKELKKSFLNPEEFLVFKNSKTFLDLEKLNLFQAEKSGIPLKNIWISKDCTCCLNNSYWSHRYHGVKRNFQISLIGVIN